MTVAILIPVNNRHQFLARQLAYYSEVNFSGTVFIGDSSVEPHVELIHQTISMFKSNLSIEHIRLPGLKTDGVIYEIAKLVKDPYVSVAHDDDFLIPETLLECSRFLEANADYSSVTGISLSFSVAQDRPVGEFLKTGLPPQNTSSYANGRLRLLEFLGSPWPSRLCVQRTDEFQYTAELVSKLVDDEFRKLLANSIPIIRGKSKQLERLFSLRQIYIQYSPVPYAWDWITRSEWFESYVFFSDCLKSELAQQDNIDLDESEEVVKEAFQSYLNRWLANGRSAPELVDGPPLKRSWLRQIAGTVPGFRRLWRLGRSISAINTPMPKVSGKAAISNNRQEFILSSLLKDSSPYNGNFMPVYRAITMPTD